MKNDLFHFSAKPIERINPVRKGSRHEGPEPDMKPNGFWVSVGPSWVEWCHGESFALDRFNYMTRVELLPDANVLRLRGASALWAFHREFACDGEENDWQRDYIHWGRVAEKYDGIIIAPYVWERRLDGPVSRWYYRWDCASGCLWDPRCVASIECIALPDMAALIPRDEEEAVA